MYLPVWAIVVAVLIIGYNLYLANETEKRLKMELHDALAHWENQENANSRHIGREQRTSKAHDHMSTLLLKALEEQPTTDIICDLLEAHHQHWDFIIDDEADPKKTPWGKA
ncbi:hypothetical protein H0K60_004502 [Salmonella enterica]|nr:hypothetical protein [Salmonella enterica]EFR2649744.1 hypothetical protein [Salmonella enterica]EFS1408051.1 hypothetical protein [Salmonella enterica]EHQ8162541.1 hypothetical protein [Salmonella enterica]EJZ9218194.1 hypothetical protein [Salmonella enterica]